VLVEKGSFEGLLSIKEVGEVGSKFEIAELEEWPRDRAILYENQEII
jgi:hypothetical protein